MLQLNKEGHLDRTEAEKTAEKIGESNRYIGKDLINKFITKLMYNLLSSLTDNLHALPKYPCIVSP